MSEHYSEVTRKAQSVTTELSTLINGMGITWHVHRSKLSELLTRVYYLSLDVAHTLQAIDDAKRKANKPPLIEDLQDK